MNDMNEKNLENTEKLCRLDLWSTPLKVKLVGTEDDREIGYRNMTLAYLLELVNARIVKNAKEVGDILVDVNKLQEVEKSDKQQIEQNAGREM